MGSYQDLELQSSCHLCPVGHYCPQTKLKHPIPCEDHTFSVKAGKIILKFGTIRERSRRVFSGGIFISKIFSISFLRKRAKTKFLPDSTTKFN